VAQQGRALVDPEIPPLPVVVRGTQQHLGRSQPGGTGHAGNVQVGDLLAHAHLFRPDHVALPSALKHGGIQGEGPEGEGVALRGPHGPQLLPGVGHGVAGAAQHVGPDLPHVVLVPPGVVDIPRAVQAVDLRGPDVDALGAGLVLDPEDPLLRVPQAGERVRTAQHDPVILRHRGGEVVPALLPPENIGVCPLPDEGPVIRSFANRSLIHSNTSCRSHGLRGRSECIIVLCAQRCKPQF
jgi:hypothetical protein